MFEYGMFKCWGFVVGVRFEARGAVPLGNYLSAQKHHLGGGGGHLGGGAVLECEVKLGVKLPQLRSLGFGRQDEVHVCTSAT